MTINYTKVYRLWFILTVTSVLSMFVIYFTSYNALNRSWSGASHNLYILFTGMLLAAVLTRIYMAVTKINPVPLMHLIKANSFKKVLGGLFYIALCSALLITLLGEIYLVTTERLTQLLWVVALRDATQPIFAIMVVVHTFYAVFMSLVGENQNLHKLMHAKDA